MAQLPSPAVLLNGRARGKKLDELTNRATMQPMHARLIGMLAAVGLAVLGSSGARAQNQPPRQADVGGATALTVPHTEFTLPNGLHVILHQDKTVPVAAVNLWYHVGSGREKPGRTGFAHLFEHIMFEGSRARGRREFRRRGSRQSAAATTARRPRTARTTSSTCRAMRWSWPCFSSRIAWAPCCRRSRRQNSTGSAMS